MQQKRKPALTENGDFMKLRIPESKKDKDWYIFQAKRLVPSMNSLPVHDYDEMNKLYKFVNNDFDGFEEEIQHYCGNLEEYGMTKERLVPYNPIPQKLEVLKGELLSMGNTMRIILLTAQAHRNRDKELRSLIMRSVNEELRLELEAMEAQMQGMPEEQVQQLIEQLRTEIAPKDIDIKNFSSEAEITFNKLLNYTFYDQDINTKKLETFTDTVIVDRFFVYPGWKHGKPYIKILNPLHIGFNKAPDVPFVQHGDYVWYRDEITLADALQEYQNKLNDEDLQHLYQFGFNSSPQVTKEHIEKPVFDQTRWFSLLAQEYGKSFNDKGVGMHQGIGHSHVNWTASIFRTHLEFKAFKEVIFLKYTDEDGVPVEIMLPGKADVIPDYASEIDFINKFNEESCKYVWSDEEGRTYEAECLWVPRRYEVTRLGENVYVDFREVPYQPDNVENPFTKFELTYKGGIVNSRNARFISLLQRALPYAFQLMAVENLVDREIADYVGHEKVVDVQQIPDELATNAINGEGNPSAVTDKSLQAEIIARKTKTRFVDSMQTTNGLQVPHTRGKGVEHAVIDTSPGISALKNLTQQINMQCGLAMGISPQREAMAIPGTNVSDNRQSLVQSTLSTQTYFYYHDRVWQSILSEHLYNLKTWIKKVFEDDKVTDHQLQYVLPNGSVEVLKVTPETLQKLEDIGLYIGNAAQDKLYFNIIQNNMQALFQNMDGDLAAISGAVKAIVSSNSIEEVHKEMQMIGESTRRKMIAVEEAKQKTVDMQKKAQMEMLDYQAELKLVNDLKTLEEKQKLEMRIAELEADRLRIANDVNKNSTADSLELEREKMAFEAVENQKDRDVEIQKAKISASKKPASK